MPSVPLLITHPAALLLFFCSRSILKPMSTLTLTADKPSHLTDDPSIDWTFHNEYMFVFTFDESGEKINRVVEMLDSMAVTKVQVLLKRAGENLAKSKGQA